MSVLHNLTKKVKKVLENVKKYLTTGFFSKVVMIFLFFNISFLTGQDQATFIDNFNTVSSNNNNGTHAWATPWIEFEPYQSGNTIGNGFIRITGNRLRLSYMWDENIKRTADLSGYEKATLSFNWQTRSLEQGERLSIQVSDNPDNGWVTLGVFEGQTTGVFSEDISAFISSQTTIRFINTGTFWSDNGDRVFIDNVTIRAIRVIHYMRNGKHFLNNTEQYMKF